MKKLILPQLLSHQPTAGNVAQVCKVSLTDTHCSVVIHSVTIHNDLPWSTFVHGHHLNCSDLPAQYSVPEKIDACSLNLILARLDECTVCPGHPDEHFVKMLEKNNISIW